MRRIIILAVYATVGLVACAAPEPTPPVYVSHMGYETLAHDGHLDVLVPGLAHCRAEPIEIICD